MSKRHDFFISYNGRDRDWAEWIAWTLEEDDRYSVLVQAWDFRPGQNFVLQMHRAATETDRTLVVLSPNYLTAEYTQPEWAVAVAHDPSGTSRKLIPVRVAPCQPEGLLKAIIYADLVGLSQDEARTVVLDAIPDRAKPDEPPVFPGGGGNGGGGDPGPVLYRSLGEATLRGGELTRSGLGATRAPEEPPTFPGAPAATAGRAGAAFWHDKLAFLVAHHERAVDPDQRRALAAQIAQTRDRL